eukprot:TRINITY_DN23721_c0_g1_i1.p1 TRINITY_DN23721_c0_g1~~TRINITY_DN23721_c0_g1_i1.p1  ORF type:complete len:583 (-),score=248.31 TRINITY_DN23721_c0_g1_i1:201-1949(-)
MANLNNDYFRQLLTAPRSESSSGKKELSEKEKAKNEKKKVYARKALKLKEKEDVKPKYRDRAEERRRNENPDYKTADDEQLLTGFNQVAPAGDKYQDPEEKKKAIREMIEKSKFLGGDMEHTHLVKGLDKALLDKVRNEPEPKREKEDDEVEVTAASVITPFVKKDRKRQELRAKRDKDEAERIQRKEKAAADAEWSLTAGMEFSTPLGRSVHFALFGRELPKSTQAFLPGRTAFVFDLETTDEIPTTLIRSKDDCPAARESVRDVIDQDLMDRLSSILSYVRGGSKKKKKGAAGAPSKNEPPPAAPPKPKVKNPDDDIFGDVGSDYVPEVRTDRVKKDQQPRTDYFGAGKRDDAMDAQPLSLPDELKSVEQFVNRPGAQARPQEYAATTDPFMQPYVDPYYSQYDAYGNPYHYSAEAAAAGQDPYRAPKLPGTEPAEKPKPKRKLDERERDPNFVGNEYAECYPGTYEMAFEAYEGSDDEADLSKMDVGKKNRLRRWDFDTEEAWSSYNEKREAMPKAAFQFGVKTADGRKTRKTKEDKISRDLKKINMLIKERENLGTSTSATAQEMSKRKKNDHSGDYD